MYVKKRKKRTQAGMARRKTAGTDVTKGVLTKKGTGRQLVANLYLTASRKGGSEHGERRRQHIVPRKGRGEDNMSLLSAKGSQSPVV